MLNRALPDLVESDFSQLVSNNVSEARDLEFKRDWPGGSNDDKKEFLADVSALANAQGGDLIFGIEESKEGVAIAVPGIDGANPDAGILRLEEILRAGIAPRLNVRMRWIPLATGSGALVIRVPASLAAPHRVIFQNSGKFFSRNSRGKYEMDVHELRHAFTQSEELPERLRHFHDLAVQAAYGEDMPYLLDDSPVAVISVMPLGLLREQRDLALTPENTILPVKSRNGEWLPILEGMYWHTPLNDNKRIRAYALTHRRGYIDAGFTIGGTREVRPGRSEGLVWSNNFEAGVIEMVVCGCTRLQSYGIEGPWVILVTVLKIKGHKLVISDTEFSMPAWRQSARLPELIIEHPSEDALKPLFKAFWPLFGEIRGL